MLARHIERIIMPKKSLRISTRGTNIMLSENKADVKRRRAEKAGLNPKVEGNPITPCYHYNIGLCKEGKNIYQCTNTFCGQKFKVKKI